MAWLNGKAASYDTCARLLFDDGAPNGGDHFMKMAEAARIFAVQISNKEHRRD